MKKAGKGFIVQRVVAEGQLWWCDRDQINSLCPYDYYEVWPVQGGLPQPPGTDTFSLPLPFAARGCINISGWAKFIPLDDTAQIIKNHFPNKIAQIKNWGVGAILGGQSCNFMNFDFGSGSLARINGRFPANRTQIHKERLWKKDWDDDWDLYLVGGRFDFAYHSLKECWDCCQGQVAGPVRTTVFKTVGPAIPCKWETPILKEMDSYWSL